MKVGETYKLLLSENPTTGYTWQLNDGLNSDLISLEGNYKSDAQAPGMVGVGGVKEITIKALKSGTGKFQAQNSRPWEFKGWDNFDVGSSYNALDVPVTIEDDGLVKPTVSQGAPSMLQVGKLDFKAKDLEIDSVTSLPNFDDDNFNFGDDDLELNGDNFGVPTMNTDKPIQELNLNLGSKGKS